MKKKRRIKELTAKRWTEFCFILERKNVLHDLYVSDGQDIHLTANRHGYEINLHKVSLENMFADTDSRKQKMKILMALIHLDFLLSEGGSEDSRRYIKMGLQLSPNSDFFNYRKGVILFHHFCKASRMVILMVAIP